MILLFDDYKRKQSGKKKSEEDQEREKSVSETLRRDMCSALSRKWKASSDSDSSKDSDFDDHNTQKKLHKRKSGASGNNRGARIMPAKGTQKTVEIILEANERGDDRMMKSWSKVEKKKMDRFEDVVMKIAARDSKLKDRVDGLSQDMGDIRADIQELKGGIQEMLLMMRAARNVE